MAILREERIGGQRLILATELSDLSRGHRDWSEVSVRYVRLGAPRASTETTPHSRVARRMMRDESK